jgi:hypothetical protein
MSEKEYHVYKTKISAPFIINKDEVRFELINDDGLSEEEATKRWEEGYSPKVMLSSDLVAAYNTAYYQYVCARRDLEIRIAIAESEREGRLCL